MTSVLIIEDDQSYRNLLVKSLKGEGIETVSASNGKEGLTLLNSHEVGLILLDLLMPGMDGNTFVYELNQTQYKNIPIIIITNLNETAYPENVKGLLVKANTSIEEIIAKVKEYIT